MLPRESVQIRDSHTGAPGADLMSGGKPETAMGDPQIQSNWLVLSCCITVISTEGCVDGND